MRKLLLSALLLVGVSSLSAQSTLYSTSDFSGWFLGTKPVVSGGALVTAVSTSNSALAYFEAPGGQYTMTNGETLTLTTNFTMASGTSVSSNRTLYLTLQNSNSTVGTNNQVTANLAGATGNAIFTNYTGYGLLLNPGPSASTTGQFDVRTASNSNITASTAAWTTPATGTASATLPSATYSFSTAANYQLSYAITQVSSTEMDFAYTLTNLTTSATLASSSGTATGLSGVSFVSSFDTIALGVSSAQTGSFKFTGVSLTSSLSAPVPEPATFALAAGVVGLAYAGLRRRLKPASV